MPTKAMQPKRLNKLIWAPKSQWPKLIPINPKGMRPNTAIPCKGLRKVKMMTKSINAKMSGMMA